MGLRPEMELVEKILERDLSETQRPSRLEISLVEAGEVLVEVGEVLAEVGLAVSKRRDLVEKGEMLFEQMLMLVAMAQNSYLERLQL
jgi:hypothetical protein